MNVQSLVNKHQDTLGFVLGAGPSLHQDISVVEDYISLAVNSAVSKAKFCDYFLADDIGAKHWNYYTDILPKLQCTSLLYETKLKGTANHLDPDKVVWFKHKWWYDPKNDSKNPEGLTFTKGGPIIGARTAAGSAVHFLYLMGCNPIVLLGCDCCYKQGKRYFWQFPREEKCYRNNGEPVYINRNQRDRVNGYLVDKHCRDFLNYWSQLSKQAEKQNIKIIDCSNGVLDCFEKMNVGQVIEKYGHKKANVSR